MFPALLNKYKAGNIAKESTESKSEHNSPIPKVMTLMSWFILLNQNHTAV